MKPVTSHGSRFPRRGVTQLSVVAALALLTICGCVRPRPPEGPAPERVTTATLGGSSLLEGASEQGRVVERNDRFAVLEYATPGAGVAQVFANELIVTAPDEAGFQRLIQHVRDVGASGPLRLVFERRIPGRPVGLVRASAPGTHTPGAVRDALKLPPELANAVQVHPNAVLRLTANQDLLDPAPAERQWSLNNPGAIGGHPTRADADVDGADALVRMRATGPAATRDILVGVLDTGIDIAHESLAPALWRNPREIAGDGIDNDANGYVDDIHGWNFADNTPDLRDADGHGTHVSGIIAARRPLRPGAGMWGVAPFAKLVTAKIPLGSSRVTSAFVVASAVEYVAAQGADVINMSFGGPTLDPFFRDAIGRVADRIHMVAAAGNDNSDLGTSPLYPCSLDRVICVVSTTSSDERAASSNYDPRDRLPDGHVRLFIAAPGDQIFSTVPSGFEMKGGTSMAAPLVAGTLAALISMHPSASFADRLVRLFGNADRIPQLAPFVPEGRRLNTYEAIYGPVASMHRDTETPYCTETISTPHDPQPHPRSANRPYANSGEPGADGTVNRPFTVCNVEQLSNIRDEDLGRVFHLRQHIHWKPNHAPIGGSPRAPGQGPVPFTGLLNGNGFSIFGLSFQGVSTGGLIAHLGGTGQVVDLHLRGVDLRTTAVAGAVAAISEGRIALVDVDGRVEGGLAAGGLVGEMRAGVIDRSYFSGEVSGARDVGGLAGVAGRQAPARPTEIRASQARGLVRGGTAGGLAGTLQWGATISSSYAWAQIPSASVAGGVAGRVRCGSKVSASYAQGAAEGTFPAGTVVGQLEDAHLDRSYGAVFISPGADRGGAVARIQDGLGSSSGGAWKFVCSGNGTRPAKSTVAATYFDRASSAGGGAAGTAKTPAELRQASTFVGWFDGTTEWHLEPGYMPVLRGLPRSW